MDVEIVKGNRTHISDCEEALVKSSLGKYYFERSGSAHEAIEEGLKYGTLYVAVVENVCVGFLFYIMKGAFHSFPYVHLIAVKEEYRGKGIGKQLMHYFEKAVHKKKLFLVVADFNPEAKRFYESIGYREVGQITGLYREGITEYVMMKENVE
jgi:ribosomal protein S18 acetylase RimI-like enzyme